MFALDVELLTGRYVATEYNDRGKAEWPPHPARLFSALVAAHFESPEPPEKEAEALMWLERQAPPEIKASNAWHREVVTVFVPVNDATVLRGENTEVAKAEERLIDAQESLGRSDASGDKKARKKAEGALTKAGQALHAALAKANKAPAPKELTAGAVEDAVKVLPERRGRQPRTFPSVRPDDATVSFVWPAAEPPEPIASALANLAARVVRLGHSSSLVHARVGSGSYDATFTPHEGGDRVLRVPKEGQLARLKEQYALHQEVAPRVMPAAYQAYRSGRPASEPAVPQSVFGSDWVVFARVGGPRLPSTRAADVASAIRNALMKYGPQPVPEFVSGHRQDGSATDRPHVAIVPLPFVGHPHADGAILGVALVLPTEIEDEAKLVVYAALNAWEAAQPDPENATLPVLLGPAGVLELQILSETARLSTLRSQVWCRPSRRWVSVTPVALDRNPGDLRSRDPNVSARAAGEAEATIGTACERIGLPRPARVVVLPHAGLVATEKAKRFAPFPREKSRTRRVLAHAIVEFDEPVQGPLLLGAGRFLGIGLFRPVSDFHGPNDE
jgi:CRISPR-associated protein Csb2